MEDAYTYYVMLLGISEDVFWDADLSFVKGIVENKAAFDGWKNYVEYKHRERAKREARHKRRH